MAHKRAVLITGGTINLGYHAALHIAREHPDYLIVLSSRSDRQHAAEAINKTLNQNNVVFMALDLADTNNVRAYAKEWASKNWPPIQALLLNAGLQFPAELHKTAEGLEATFAINHVGHALLFHLLCPFLAPSARVVVTSSGTHDPAQKTGLPDAVYNTAEELAHPPASTINDPGHRGIAINAESGASLARLAIADDVAGVSGKYFEGRKEIKSSRDSYDERKQDDLWQWTVKYLALDEAQAASFGGLK
ncbi:putative dehydrogenase reductase protein [Eutypa lata UCREL1]|uniref:Putative dehydrogenase reductase protein n=1 Tax=Eutypa lata (strain UCR-EL1) TaxID=1287681 RepID=M7SCH7_EUTLA|nr:putative dehydrogenase reductase protein [Eutypa lata UCREL1]